MAYRLNKKVVRGEIDNRTKDRVLGKLWLHGAEEPVTLNLKGNCLRDIAGHLFVFENPSPEPLTPSDSLYPEQEGVTGDITASRKVREFDIPLEEALDRMNRGETAPEHMANCLYMEWYSARNGRVVVEMTGFRIVELSDPEWQMTEQEEDEQASKNIEAIQDYMAELDHLLSSTPEDHKPMDEFDWEREFKESDQRTDECMKVFEKYRNHPDSHRLIAREMGWDRIDDALDAEERGAFEEEMGELESIPEPQPDPATEGIDWIRRENGHICHPLACHASDLALDMWRKAEEAGHSEANRDPALEELLFQTQTLGAKLAGALNHLAYETAPGGGFVVAYLKRALQYLDGALKAIPGVAEKSLLDQEHTTRWRHDLFAIREQILQLMKKHRKN